MRAHSALRLRLMYGRSRDNDLKALSAGFHAFSRCVRPSLKPALSEPLG